MRTLFDFLQRCLVIACDCAVVFAIAEQVIWRGELKWFYYLLVTLFLVSQVSFLTFQSRTFLTYIAIGLAAAGLTFGLLKFQGGSSERFEHLSLFAVGVFAVLFRDRRRIPHFGTGMPIPILVTGIGLIIFSLVADFDMRPYYQMAHEPVNDIFYCDIWGVVALLTISIAFLTALKREALDLCRALIALGGLLIWIALFVRGAIPLPQTIDLKLDPQFCLASCFIILAVHTFTTKDSPRFKGFFAGFSRLLDQLFLVIVIMAPLLSGIYWMLYLRDHPICVPRMVEYQVSEELALQMLVSEDPIFLFHHGVDYHRMRMVLREAIETQKLTRGGSTLSMQLAKLCYLDNSKTFLRKWNQVVIGYLIELRHSKEQILRAYFERIPFSPTITGVTQAARTYFNKSPSELNAEEAMQLVLTVFNPIEFNPTMSVMSSEVKQRRTVIEARVREFRGFLLESLKPLPSIVLSNVELSRSAID